MKLILEKALINRGRLRKTLNPKHETRDKLKTQNDKETTEARKNGITEKKDSRWRIGDSSKKKLY